MFGMIRRVAAVCPLLMALLALAACGSSGSAPAVRVSPTPSSAATSVAPSPSAVAATATTSAASASAAALTGRYAGIQQSQTAEGYYMLGDPAAPVVLMHYSDFL